MEENIGQRILSKDLENIVKKVASGKTLTNSERALIESEYGEKEKSVRYAKTIVELADILGVNRKTIDRWRKMKGSPKSKPDGRQDISKWRQFIKKNGLKEADTSGDEATFADAMMNLLTMEFDIHMRYGRLSDKPKVQKYHTKKEFYELFSPFFRNVQISEMTGNVNAKCENVRRIPWERLEEALRFEFNLPYPDGSRMRLVGEAISAFKHRYEILG